eukprot:g64173.t1
MSDGSIPLSDDGDDDSGAMSDSCSGSDSSTPLSDGVWGMGGLDYSLGEISDFAISRKKLRCCSGWSLLRCQLGWQDFDFQEIKREQAAKEYVWIKGACRLCGDSGWQCQQSFNGCTFKYCAGNRVSLYSALLGLHASWQRAREQSASAANFPPALEWPPPSLRLGMGLVQCRYFVMCASRTAAGTLVRTAKVGGVTQALRERMDRIREYAPLREPKLQCLTRELAANEYAVHCNPLVLSDKPHAALQNCHEKLDLFCTACKANWDPSVAEFLENVLAGQPHCRGGRLSPSRWASSAGAGTAVVALTEHSRGAWLKLQCAAMHIQDAGGKASRAPRSARASGLRAFNKKFSCIFSEIPGD